jgi:hypothetical protein
VDPGGGREAIPPATRWRDERLPAHDDTPYRKAGQVVGRPREGDPVRDRPRLADMTAGGDDGARTGGRDGLATVLVLARDVVGAGLLGALVEVSGRKALFPLTGEGPEWAVGRLRPSAVVLDAHHGAARSDAFWAAADEAGCRVILFSPGRPWEEARALAERRRAVWVCPEPGESLGEQLAAALAD